MSVRLCEKKQKIALDAKNHTKPGKKVKKFRKWDQME